MIHELLTIENNHVSLKDVPGVRPELETVQLCGNTNSDDFFDANMFRHIGIVCDEIKDLVEKLQKITPSKQTLQTIGVSL